MSPQAARERLVQVLREKESALETAGKIARQHATTGPDGFSDNVRAICAHGTSRHAATIALQVMALRTVIASLDE